MKTGPVCTIMLARGEQIQIHPVKFPSITTREFERTLARRGKKLSRKMKKVTCTWRTRKYIRPSFPGIGLVGDGTGGDPRVDANEPNRVWVRAAGRGVVPVLNTRVANCNDAPVAVGYTHERPDTLQILGFVHADTTSVTGMQGHIGCAYCGQSVQPGAACTGCGNRSA